MTTLMFRLWQEEGGATSIEYALLAVMAAVGAIAGLTAFAESSDRMWTYVSDTIQSVLGG